MWQKIYLARQIYLGLKFTRSHTEISKKVSANSSSGVLDHGSKWVAPFDSGWIFVG